MGFRRLAVMVLFAVLIFVPFLHAAQQDTQDAKGSHDHPLVTRMPGYYISSYKVSEFDGYEPTVIGGKDVRWEGKKYSIGYSRKEGARPINMLQIVRNYQGAIKQAGGKFIGTGDERRMTAEIRKGGALTGVYVEAFNEGRDYELTIVDSQPMQQEVAADAKAMKNDLGATGKTIVQGIYFDTASATIKPESGPALAEMAKLLKTSPSLKVYIIGHTDTVGNLSANLKLSSDRAASVVNALAAKGVATLRMKSGGVGPYSPVASNRDEAGRAKNRRVELVEQ